MPLLISTQPFSDLPIFFGAITEIARLRSPSEDCNAAKTFGRHVTLQLTTMGR